MGRAIERLADARSERGIHESRAGDSERFPEISDLLVGKAGSSGTAWERHPYKLLLWLEGSQVKFCFTFDGCQEKLWGSAPSLREGLEGIEEALCRGNFEWKQAKKYENGFTHSKR